MSGTGDVVMTDVRQTTATLVLPEEFEGRFFVRTAAQELVVELYKPRGRKVELAIEPGDYEVRVEREKGSFVSKATVGDGGRTIVDSRQFGPAALEPTQRRGAEVKPRYAVAGRNRIEMRVGSWSKGDNGATVTTGIIGLDAFGGFGYTRYVREDLAVTFSVDSFGVDSGSSAGPNGVGAGLVGGWSVPIGIRWNPLRGDHRRQSLKPFLALGVGPVIGTSQGSFVGKTVSTGIVSAAPSADSSAAASTCTSRVRSRSESPSCTTRWPTSLSRSACATTTTVSRSRWVLAGCSGKDNRRATPACGTGSRAGCSSAGRSRRRSGRRTGG